MMRTTLDQPLLITSLQSPSFRLLEPWLSPTTLKWHWEHSSFHSWMWVLSHTGGQKWAPKAWAIDRWQTSSTRTMWPQRRSNNSECKTMLRCSLPIWPSFQVMDWCTKATQALVSISDFYDSLYLALKSTPKGNIYLNHFMRCNHCVTGLNDTYGEKTIDEDEMEAYFNGKYIFLHMRKSSSLNL